MDIQLIPPEATHDLRHRILRNSAPDAVLAWPGDTAQDAFHLGLYDGERLIGIVTLLPPAAVQNPAQEGWQLRGMAIDTEFQGQGHGERLLSAAFSELGNRGAGRVWCNARTSAVGFYRKAGFESEGAVFDVPGIGPHVVMTRPLAKNNSD